MERTEIQTDMAIGEEVWTRPGDGLDKNVDERQTPKGQLSPANKTGTKVIAWKGKHPLFTPTVPGELALFDFSIKY